MPHVGSISVRDKGGLCRRGMKYPLWLQSFFSSLKPPDPHKFNQYGHYRSFQHIYSWHPGVPHPANHLPYILLQIMHLNFIAGEPIRPCDLNAVRIHLPLITSAHLPLITMLYLPQNASVNPSAPLLLYIIHSLSGPQSILCHA